MKKITNIQKHFKTEEFSSYCCFKKRKYTYVYINKKLVGKWRNEDLPIVTVGRLP